MGEEPGAALNRMYCTQIQLQFRIVKKGCQVRGLEELAARYLTILGRTSKGCWWKMLSRSYAARQKRLLNRWIFSITPYQPHLIGPPWRRTSVPARRMILSVSLSPSM